MHTIHLNKDRAASLLRRHPWVFSGAIARLSGQPSPGETVRIVDAPGTRLPLAGFSPSSQIRARVWSLAVDDTITADFVARRLEAAVARRRALLDDSQRTGCRLVYGESDDLPGLIVDRYGDFLVC